MNHDLGSQLPESVKDFIGLLADHMAQKCHLKNGRTALFWHLTSAAAGHVGPKTYEEKDTKEMNFLCKKCGIYKVGREFPCNHTFVCLSCQPPKETQETITAWVESTFGPAGSNARVLARANEEMAELLRSVTIDDRHQDIPEEMADVVIVLYRVATRLGVDLMEEVDKKMAANRARQWELDGSGCGYHK